MKNKIICLLAALMLLCLCACSSSKKEEQVPETTPEPTAETSAEPTAETKEETVDYLAEVGEFYVDQIAGRGMLTVTKNSGTEAAMDIHWSSSAAEHTVWKINAVYNPENGHLEYSGAVKEDHVFDENQNETTETVYTDGTGYFEIGDRQLIWHDDKAEVEGAETVFVDEAIFADGVQVANPWTETTDAMEAADIAGFAVTLPVEQALPYDVHFYKYICMPDVFGALYESVNDELLIRVSPTYSGTDLAGDFSNYSKEWTISHKGLSITLRGDGKTANNAFYSFDGNNYAIIFNAGYESYGLTEDQVTSLVTGIQ